MMDKSMFRMRHDHLADNAVQCRIDKTGGLREKEMALLLCITSIVVTRDPDNTTSHGGSREESQDAQNGLHDSPRMVIYYERFA